MAADDIERVILAGATRIPLVKRLMESHLPNTSVNSFEPDLRIGLGAALQAGVLSVEAVDAILVDIT